MNKSRWLWGLAMLWQAAAGSAMAADLTYKAPPAPVAYNWTGCHVGFEAGGAWGSSQHIQDDTRPARGFGLPPSNPFDGSGALIRGPPRCAHPGHSPGVRGRKGTPRHTLRGSAPPPSPS